MTEEDRKFFADARDMFLTPGWAAFKEDVLKAHEGVGFDSCTTSDEFWASKGARNALAFVLNWEAAVIANEAQQEEDDAADL